MFFYGRNFTGGRFIFTSLGVSVCADPGYSFHARFKLLEHAVGTIRPGPDIHSPPLRVSLALYSHADVYAGPARVSAARRGSAHFSDQSMWLPFAPTNFQIDTCCKILRKEENKWRIKFKKISICHQKMMEDQWYFYIHDWYYQDVIGPRSCDVLPTISFKQLCEAWLCFFSMLLLNLTEIQSKDILPK